MKYWTAYQIASSSMLHTCLRVAKIFMPWCYRMGASAPKVYVSTLEGSMCTRSLPIRVAKLFPTWWHQMVASAPKVNVNTAGRWLLEKGRRRFSLHSSIRCTDFHPISSTIMPFLTYIDRSLANLYGRNCAEIYFYVVYVDHICYILNPGPPVRSPWVKLVNYPSESTFWW